MLKFKVSDPIYVASLNSVVNKREGMFIGAVGDIIVADESKAFPYQVKFYDKEIENLNLQLGIRLWDENELRFQ